MNFWIKINYLTFTNDKLQNISIVNQNRFKIIEEAAWILRADILSKCIKNNLIKIIRLIN